MGRESRHAQIPPYFSGRLADADRPDESFKMVGKYDFDCGLGIVGIRHGTFLIGRGGGTGDQRTGKVLVGRADEEMGLVVQPEER